MVSSKTINAKNLDDGVFAVELNRPPVNGLNADMLKLFSETLDELSADKRVKAVVLTSPLKVFSAGLNLKEAQGFNLDDEHDIVHWLNVSFLKLFAFPKPTIAAVNGPAIAGGLFFVLASDQRVANDGASFGLAEVRVGVSFPVGPLEIARASLGPNDLRRLMLSGKPINAQAALAAGIVDKVVEGEKLQDAATEIAKDMAQIPPQAFAAVKRQIRGSTIEFIENAIAAGTGDKKQGWFTEETKAAMAKMLG